VQRDVCQALSTGSSSRESSAAVRAAFDEMTIVPLEGKTAIVGTVTTRPTPGLLERISRVGLKLVSVHPSSACGLGTSPEWARARGLPYASDRGEPVPIAAVLVLLTCRHAIANGLSFLLGWTAGVAALIVVLVKLVDAAGVSDADPAWLAPRPPPRAFFVVASVVVFRRRRRRAAGAAPWIARSTSSRPALGRARRRPLGREPEVIALSLGAAIAVAEAGAACRNDPSDAALHGCRAAGIVVPLAVTRRPVRSESALTRYGPRSSATRRPVLVVLGLVIAVLFSPTAPPGCSDPSAALRARGGEGRSVTPAIVGPRAYSRRPRIVAAGASGERRCPGSPG